MSAPVESLAPAPRARRPSRFWAALACYGAALALVAIAVALASQRSFALERELFFVRATGWGALVALLLALVASPVGRLLDRVGRRRLARGVPAFRRASGISAAALASLHAAASLSRYLGGALTPILEHAWLRGGALALAILLALWLTSYPRLTRALRVKLWKPLHRLAFVAALFALQHTLLSPLAPRLWVLVAFGAALALGLMRFVPRQPSSQGESRS